VPTTIAFCRTRIRGNIPVSRGDKPPREALPPISIEENAGEKNWVWGVKIFGPSTIFYQAHGSEHKAWIETGAQISFVDETDDDPKWERGRLYLFVQLRLIGQDTLPPLTKSWFPKRGRRESLCAWRLDVPGKSTVVSSLGRPRPGTGKKDSGVRVWVETTESVSPGPKGWFVAKTDTSFRS
jgi:hypothetical protein